MGTITVHGARFSSIAMTIKRSPMLAQVAIVIQPTLTLPTRMHFF